MIFAIALLGLAGYGAVRGWLDERDRLAAFSLGLASAWPAFIVVLNLALRAHVPFGLAVALAVSAILAVGLTGLLRARRVPAATDGLDAALVAALACGVSAMVLLFQFLGPDSDNFIHYPLVALFAKGHFPHFNPYFPDVPLHGHYGRDLGLAGLLSFGGVGIGTAMAIEAWVLHLATLGNVYVIGKRTTGSRFGGVATAYVVFFAVNSGFHDWIVRSGLAEVMGNNNPVVYAFFFSIVALVPAVVSTASPAAVAWMGLLLGGFDIVYETHFHVLFAALAILAAVVAFPSVRWPGAAGAGRGLPTALVIALLVMLSSGGLTSRMFLGRLRPGPAPAAADAGTTASSAAEWARAGIQQDVKVSFPKRPFLSLTHAANGAPVPLLSRGFMRGQGTAVVLLPLVAVWLFLRRNLCGLVAVLVATISFLVPASFDFGRFNGENFRYIFLGGLGAAMALGLGLGEADRALARRLGGRPWTRIVIVVIASLLLLREGSRAWGLYRHAALMVGEFPHLFRITEAERLEQFCAGWGRADEQASRFLRENGRRGERLASNYVMEDNAASTLLNNAMVVMSQTGLPMVGFNQRLERETGGIRASVGGWSGRAIAFWATGDAEILRDLGADWLYVVPEGLARDSGTRIAATPALAPAFRSSVGVDRIVYRVRRDALGHRPRPSAVALAGLVVAGLDGVDGGVVEEFRFSRLRVANRGKGPIRGQAYISYLPYDLTAGADLDPADAVGTVHALDIAAGGEQTLAVPFVFPYDTGAYELRFTIETAEGPRRIDGGGIGVVVQPSR